MDVEWFKFFVRVAYCVFNRNKIGGGYEIKWQKYYLPLMRYYQRMPLKYAYDLIKDELEGRITHIPRIAIFITSRCPLNCMGCSTLIPLMERQDVDTDLIISDLQLLDDELKSVECLGLTGGEPLLHHDIDVIIKRLLQMPVYKRIEIISNGFGVLRLNEYTLNKMSDKRIHIILSSYGNTNRSQILRAVWLLNKNKVNYEVIDDNYPWWDFGTPKYMKKNHSKAQYMECYAPEICRTIYKSKFYSCFRGVYMFEKDMAMKKNHQLVKGMIPNILYDFYSDWLDEVCKYCNYKGKQIERAKQI